MPLSALARNWKEGDPVDYSALLALGGEPAANLARVAKNWVK